MRIKKKKRALGLTCSSAGTKRDSAEPCPKSLTWWRAAERIENLEPVTQLIQLNPEVSRTFGHMVEPDV